MINVGVIGCGYWGPNLIRNFEQIPHARLAAVCDRDSDRLSHVQGRYPGALATRDYQEVLANRALVSITSNVEAASLMQTYPELTVIPIDQARSRRPGAFLLAQDDQVWINYVNHWIDLMHAQGLFVELGEKWGLAQ